MKINQRCLRIEKTLRVSENLSKSVWKIIINLNISSNISKQIKFGINNNTIVDLQSVSNEFNKYFSSVAMPLNRPRPDVSILGSKNILTRNVLQAHFYTIGQINQLFFPVGSFSISAENGKSDLRQKEPVFKKDKPSLPSNNYSISILQLSVKYLRSSWNSLNCSKLSHQIDLCTQKTPQQLMQSQISMKLLSTALRGGNMCSEYFSTSQKHLTIS